MSGDHWADLPPSLPSGVRVEYDSEAGIPVKPAPMLAELAGMLYREGLHLFAGWNGTGKSTLVHTIAAQCAASGKRVTWVRNKEDVTYKVRNQALNKPPILSVVATSVRDAFAVLAQNEHARTSQLLVIDPIREILTPGASNDKTHVVAEAVNELLGLTEGRCLVGIHHLRKQGERKAPFAERLVGSAEWTNKARLVMGVDKLGSDGIAFGQVKNSFEETAGVWTAAFETRPGMVYDEDAGRNVEHPIAVPGRPVLEDSALDFDGWLDERKREEGDADTVARALQVFDYVKREHGGRVLAAVIHDHFRAQWPQRAVHAALRKSGLRRTRDKETWNWRYEIPAE